MNNQPLHSKGKLRSRLAWLAGLACCAAAVLACKYNVRDVGFVDLEPTRHRLVVTPGKATPKEVVDTLRHTAGAVLLDSNVSAEFAEPVEAELAIQLISPDGRSLPLKWEPGETALADAAWAALETAVSSPTREMLLETMPSAYAVALLAEGTDAAMNAVARAATERAIKQIIHLMPDLPKQVAAPPKLVVLTRQEAARERVLLWSMGVDVEEAADPSLVILYGRGRRVGPVLGGALITQTEVYRSLAVLGQDCECELDRAWMRGPLMPSRWDAELQSAVLKHLGFDAEHPLVKAEVSRILARGPGANARPVGLTREGLVNTLGYMESEIEEPEQPSAESSAAAATPSPVSEAQSAAEPKASPTPAVSTATKASGAENPPKFLSFGVLALVALVGLGGGLAILFFRRDS